MQLYDSFVKARAAKTPNLMPAVAALHNQYGSTYRESTFHSLYLKTRDSENIQTVFGTNGKIWGVEQYRLTGMKPFCGEGLLTTDGPTWERSRAIFKPSFHKDNISDLSAFEVSLQRLIAIIPRDGSTVDLQPLLQVLFVDTASLFIFGQSLGVLTGSKHADLPYNGKAFSKAFMLSLKSCGMRNVLGILSVFLPKSATSDQWQIVHNFVDSLIDRGQRPSGMETREASRSLLNQLLKQMEDKVGIRNQAIQGMMASQDTTAMLVSNTLFLLSRHPDVWQRLKSEVAAVTSNALTVEETRKFKLLRNVLNESLRLYPVFCRLARVASKDTTLPTGGGISGDKPILCPAGTQVFCNFYALHRDEKVFGPNVEEFQPDRWESIQPGPWQYIPFGGGMRSCLGQQKALGEASCVLIRLAQAFDRIESRDGEDWAGDQKLVAQNVNGCKVALIPAV
ncbi:MAG: hypothetical protein M1820_005193 [Bogoriella megaspora]|nr:MAG: hypothetical protein M1820_005193 [Bogoriella megaspora]